jgi:hypothetical protein
MVESKQAKKTFLKQFEGSGYRVRLNKGPEQTLELITSTNRLLAEQVARRLEELRTFPPPKNFWSDLSEPTVLLAGGVQLVVVVKLDNMNVEMTAHYKLIAGERFCDVVHLQIPVR